ncbi:MAG: hypothetical protein QGG36_23700 [Pirellulaceae bacterium]|jgi:hypothetical protein|nr:hypothetical protein [Pirellulaceae bacterium]
MRWWTKNALYDTCSLITLDKLLIERPALARHFPKRILALEKSFSADQLREETVQRMQDRVTHQELPPTNDLATILTSAGLPKALAEVDTLIYATSVHFSLSVVTGDRQLARAVRDAGLQVGNMAMILRELVQSNKLAASGCERLLRALADRNELLLGSPSPTWDELEQHTFPDR